LNSQKPGCKKTVSLFDATRKFCRIDRADITRMLPDLFKTVGSVKRWFFPVQALAAR
jgi:hypothetical protein